MIKCTNCSQPYPDNGVPFLCPRCGGIFDLATESWQGSQLDNDAFSGLWRYKNNFELPENATPISLGEGNTPLVWCEIDGRQIGFKCEFLNPTGSYKDRGAALLASFLLARGVKRAVEDSSGNAGAAFAAYAARAGIHAQIYVPETASGPKITQIKAYGAQVFPVKGSREDVAQAVLEVTKAGVCYASHAYLPQVMLGYATIAYELVEQLGDAPGSVILPVGQGNLLLGIGCGFISMLKSRSITHLPRIVGVQAQSCAPLVQLFYNQQTTPPPANSKTLAEGVRIANPLRPKTVIDIVKESQGTLIAVSEQNILIGYQQLAKLGLYVEPTSALVWEGIHHLRDHLPTPIIAILTGSALKVIPSQELLNQISTQ